MASAGMRKKHDLGQTLSIDTYITYIRGACVKRSALALICLVGTSAVVAQQTSRDYSAEMEAAIRDAKMAAGFEHLGLLNRLCVLPPSLGARTEDIVPRYVVDPSTAPPRDIWYAEGARVFDDLYWLGGAIHSAWLITTSEGHILIDTQFPYNSGELILEGIRKFDLEPSDIRYIIISHAHGDHIGGVELVQEATGATVIMGEADWNLVAAFPNRYRSMTPDRSNGIEVSEAMTVTLGDQSVHIYPTPGHTEGTLSYIFTVHDYDRPVVVAYSGGTAFNFQTDAPDPGIPNLERYIQSQRRFAAIAADADATVLLSNHSEFDDAHDKSRMLAGRGFGPNPFVSGTEWVRRYFDVMIHCAQAKIVGLEQRLAQTR